MVVGGLLALAALAWAVGWLDFQAPRWLPALAVLPLLTWIAYYGRAGLPSMVNAAAATVRAALVIAIVCGLAEIQWVRRGGAVGTVFVVDVSASIPATVRQQALAYVRQAVATKRPEDRAGLVVCGAEPSLEILPTTRFELDRLHSAVDEGATQLEAAVRLAVGALPPETRGKIVLISDGNETAGDLLEAVRHAAGLGVQVEVLPVSYQTTAEVWLERVRVPERLRLGETFTVSMQVGAHQATTGTLTLYRDGSRVSEREVALTAGSNVFVLSQLLADPGFRNYTARVQAADDRITQNNEAAGFAYLQGRARILLLADHDEQARYLVDACRRAELEPELAQPSAAPTTVEGLQPYDCLVLVNVEAGSFGPSQLAAMRAAVRDLGMGLIMIGGDRSFGLGQYRGTPLEEVLPVALELKQQELIPSAALAIAIDISGSMEGEKLEQAKPAAWAAIETLAPTDQAGVIAFDEAPHWLAPMQTLTDPARLRLAITQLAGGGGTDILAALRGAHQALVPLDASIKHVLLLSDGQSDASGYETLMAALAKDRITVTTIGIGEAEGQPFMAELARRGGGRYHQVVDPRQLPRVFVKEARLLQRNLIFVEPFTPQLAASSELTRDLRQAEVPPLLAYVGTSAKPGATVPLVSANVNRDPILAYWRHGLGKSVAFTSDATSNWARQWLGWGQFTPFWGQVLRWAARERDESQLLLATRVEGTRGYVVVDALDPDGEYLNHLELTGRQVSPDNSGRPIALRQTGPGRYEGEFVAEQAGVNLLHVGYRDPRTGQAGFVTGAVAVPYPAEYRCLATDREGLAAAALAGGGRTLSGDAARDRVFASTQPPVRLPRAGGVPFVVLALVLLLSDITLRRVILSRTDVRALWLRLTGRAVLERDATLGALLARKGQLAPPLAPPLAAPTAFQIRLRQQDARVARTAAAAQSPAAAAPDTPPPTPTDGYTDRLLTARQRAQEARAGRSPTP